jgi:hypothetical protein
VSRYDRGTLLCQRVMTKVNDITPEGLGREEAVWEFVSPASAAFWLALSNWEATGSEKDADTLTDAYERLMTTWSEAVALFSRNAHEGEAP